MPPAMPPNIRLGPRRNRMLRMVSRIELMTMTLCYFFGGGYSYFSVSSTTCAYRFNFFKLRFVNAALTYVSSSISYPNYQFSSSRELRDTQLHIWTDMG